MKRIFTFFLAVVFCSFTTKMEAGKRQNNSITQIPTLDPLDEKWNWMDAQIEKDFETIESISESALIKDLKALKKTAPRKMIRNVRRYEIKDGVVFGPNDRISKFLKAIIARYPVPDLVFLYLYQDIVRIDFFETYRFTTPILCSAKAPNTDGKIIHFIDWYYDISKTDTGWNQILMAIDKKYQESSWKEKLPILFWRGSTTTKHLECFLNLTDFPRGNLVHYSLTHPTLIDARFNHVFHRKEQRHFPKAPTVSIPDHLNDKYQIAMDGETATYPGYQWRLYSGCLTFKQDSDETMWYYGALKPFVHYVPVQMNLEDLVEKVEWAKANDDKAHEIAENARSFAKENLLPEHMLLYGYKVLSKYALKFKK
jgi:hypothetical protein